MNKLTKGLMWKLLERFGVSSVQFILQIILARLLDPEHYGILSLMLIFITIANVFIQSGFNTSLIQNKDVTEEDYSSVFWVSLGISVILYGIVYFTAPWVSVFYSMPELIQPLRILALVLLPGTFNSVQLAKVSRMLDFKKVFYSNTSSIVVSGIVGIVMAYAGAGLWALVTQYILNIVVACLVMLYTVKWVPQFIINWKRVCILFSYGWKLLLSALIDTIYADLYNLVIGKKYNKKILAHANRGKQFPSFLINAINGTVQSVMLPAMSDKQDDVSKVKIMTRNSIMISSYIIIPMMAGLASVAEPMVRLLLTDKWLPCVPYMQIYCFSMSLYPIHSCNLQAINAVGRSDIFLKLEIIKKTYGTLLLVIAVVFFDSPITIAMTSMFTTLISGFVNSYPNRKLIGYSYSEQIQDILPSMICTSVMFAIVLTLGNVINNVLGSLFIQITGGIIVYTTLSALFKLEPYVVTLGILKSYFKENKRETL